MSSEIINADDDSALREKERIENPPPTKPKEPKVATSRNGIMLIQ
jgi:hypothetical protein